MGVVDPSLIVMPDEGDQVAPTSARPFDHHQWRLRETSRRCNSPSMAKESSPTAVLPKSTLRTSCSIEIPVACATVCLVAVR